MTAEAQESKWKHTKTCQRPTLGIGSLSPLLQLTNQSKSHGQAKGQVCVEIDSAIREGTSKLHYKVETTRRGKELAPMMQSAPVRFPFSPSSLNVMGSPGLTSHDSVCIGLFDVLPAH